jgi:NhaA family Na+:H+ antiporter
MPSPLSDTTQEIARRGGKLPRFWRFAIDHLLLLPIGAAIALVWANTAPESYYNLTLVLSPWVNDVAMVFFFGLMAKEVVEATVPGGVLHPWRRAALPVIAAAGATVCSAAIYIPAVDFLDEPGLRVAWPVIFGTDIAISYFVARMIFRSHAVVPFVLLIALTCDALGFIAIGLVQSTTEARLIQGGVLMAAAIALTVALRRFRVTQFWPYVTLGGGLAWYAFYRSGVHPAMALVPIIPLMPHAARDPGFFVDAEPDAPDALSQYERWWRYPSHLAVLLFGFVNAGVSFSALEAGTWGIPIGAIIGRPLGLMIGVAAALAIGLHLPRGVGWRELAVTGVILAIGFGIGLFFCAVLLPAGQLRHETSMGMLMTLVGIPIAFLVARALRVGRFKAP